MALTASNITVSYHSHVVIKNVTLTLHTGRATGLYGASGTGKTTLAKALCGLLSLDAGTVSVDDAVVASTRKPKDRILGGRIVMLFQSPRRSCNPRMQLWQLVAEPLMINVGSVKYRASTTVRARVEHLATEVGLTSDLLTRLPSEVSDGQLQRAALARCLASEPDYLICDEATSMLDPATTTTLMKVIQKRIDNGMAALIISHDQSLLNACVNESFDLRELNANSGAHKAVSA